MSVTFTLSKLPKCLSYFRHPRCPKCYEVAQSHELKFHGITYFLQNPNGSYSSYNSRGVPRPGALELLSKSNLNLAVKFCREGFPQVNDFTLSFLLTDYEVKGSLIFTQDKSVIEGKNIIIKINICLLNLFFEVMTELYKCELFF